MSQHTFVLLYCLSHFPLGACINSARHTYDRNLVRFQIGGNIVFSTLQAKVAPGSFKGLLYKKGQLIDQPKYKKGLYPFLIQRNISFS